MISIGIDVSKGKSTTCILEPYGVVIKKPFIVEHNKDDLTAFVNLIKTYSSESKVILEATGVYHLPILNYLISKDIFVTVVNPLSMSKYINSNIRPGKTDKKDALMIANYGIDNWYKLIPYSEPKFAYDKLRLLSRQYNQYIGIRVKARLTLINLVEQTMPGITNLLENDSTNICMDKLNSFIKKYWHYDNVTKYSERQFVVNYNLWAKKEGYKASDAKAIKIYALAENSIPTLSSKDESTKMLVLEAIRVHREINISTDLILGQMVEMAKHLKEYAILTSITGIGENLASRFIAEVGDINKFHSSSALVAYAGIDAPPHQSGQFISKNRKISKRGSKSLRKVGYEIMTSITRQKSVDDPVFLFIKKKEAEGKAKKVAKIAGLNKFFRIYFAKATEIYEN